jgi:hypothetical protein
MAKCDIRIEYENDKRSYTVGEAVRGTVYVSVNSDCKCDAFIISCMWRAHGRGNQANHPSHEETVFKGEWKAGESHSFPFEFEAPPGPLTYHGHYLNVDWYIHATADIPWALDPSAEEDFHLALADGDDTVVAIGSEGAMPELVQYLGQSASEVDSLKADRLIVDPGSQALGALLPVIAMIVMGIGLFISVIMTALMFEDMGVVAFLIGPLPIAVTSAIAFFLMRNSLAEKKLGKVDIKITPQVLLGAGSEAAVEVTFCPTASISLNSVKATLTGKERVISGSGSNRTTHTHELHKIELVLSESRQLTPGEPVTLRAPFEIPEDAPCSFSASDNYLEWNLNTHIDIPKWPDWSANRSVIVYHNAVLEGLYGDLGNEKIENAGAGEVRPPAAAAKPVAMSPSPVVEVPEPISEIVAPVAEPENGSPLESALTRLAAASFSSARNKIYEESSSPFAFDLLVQSVDETSSLDALKDRTDGQTIVGTIVGLDIDVSVQFEASLNAEVKSLQSGDQVSVNALLQGWSNLNKRAVFAAQN